MTGLGDISCHFPFTITDFQILTWERHPTEIIIFYKLVKVPQSLHPSSLFDLKKCHVYQWSPHWLVFTNSRG